MHFRVTSYFFTQLQVYMYVQLLIINTLSEDVHAYMA